MCSHTACTVMPGFQALSWHNVCDESCLQHIGDASNLDKRSSSRYQIMLRIRCMCVCVCVKAFHMYPATCAAADLRAAMLELAEPAAQLLEFFGGQECAGSYERLLKQGRESSTYNNTVSCADLLTMPRCCASNYCMLSSIDAWCCHDKPVYSRS